MRTQNNKGSDKKLKKELMNALNHQIISLNSLSQGKEIGRLMNNKENLKREKG